MDGNNLNILVEAKKEYMEQLCLLLCPLMIETFMETYRESVNMSKNKQVLIQYQKLLKEVPNWNNHIIKQHTARLCDACSWFSDLLAAVFVSCVKILSSVRLNTENKKISVKLPSNEVFIHGCYVAAAKELYKDPYIYHDQNVSEYEREANLSKRFTLNFTKGYVVASILLKSIVDEFTDRISFTQFIPLVLLNTSMLNESEEFKLLNKTLNEYHSDTGPIGLDSMFPFFAKGWNVMPFENRCI